MDRTDPQLQPSGAGFRLWTPPPDRTLKVGPEKRLIPLPAVALPIRREDLKGDGPSDDAIGRGLYDYLRQFPDCRHNRLYAETLRDAFPHFLADLAAQIAMLDHKEVDAQYVRRKIAGLRIFALLEPDNPKLLRQIGIAFFDFGLLFAELPNCRSHLLNSMAYLTRALALLPDDPTSLNYYGQIDFFLGDYPAAARRWRQVMEKLEPGAVREALAAKVARIDDLKVPDHPLVDDLEAIGAAMQAYAVGDFDQCRQIMEELEEKGTVTDEFPSPEFFYLLGLSRGRAGDLAGSFQAFERALELAPDFAPAQEGKERILEGKDF